jgi:hypothetical protein
MKKSKKSNGRLAYQIAKQRLEQELTRIGWSGSSKELPELMKSYNAKRGTFFKTPADVLRFFRIKL